MGSSDFAVEAIFLRNRTRPGGLQTVEVDFMARKSTAKTKNMPDEQYVEDSVEQPRGLGPESAGQSGDLQGLSEIPGADSESVEQLVEEGQGLEADAVAGVEDAPDADVREVRVHQRSEDDVPPEYLERDQD